MLSKPIGGIITAHLTPRGGTARSVTLIEERSSYTEEVISDDGIPRIHHTLTLVIPRSEVAALLLDLPLLTTQGASAQITTTARELLIIGWSSQFGYEQPLRLTSFVVGSGIRAADGNAATLRFESDDLTALQEV